MFHNEDKTFTDQIRALKHELSQWSLTLPIAPEVKLVLCYPLKEEKEQVDAAKLAEEDRSDKGKVLLGSLTNTHQALKDHLEKACSLENWTFLTELNEICDKYLFNNGSKDVETLTKQAKLDFLSLAKKWVPDKKDQKGGKDVYVLKDGHTVLDETRINFPTQDHKTLHKLWKDGKEISPVDFQGATQTIVKLMEDDSLKRCRTVTELWKCLIKDSEEDKRPHLIVASLQALAEELIKSSQLAVARNSGGENTAVKNIMSVAQKLLVKLMHHQERKKSGSLHKICSTFHLMLSSAPGGGKLPGVIKDDFTRLDDFLQSHGHTATVHHKSFRDLLHMPTKASKTTIADEKRPQGRKRGSKSMDMDSAPISSVLNLSDSPMANDADGEQDHDAPSPHARSKSSHTFFPSPEPVGGPRRLDRSASAARRTPSPEGEDHGKLSDLRSSSASKRSPAPKKG